MDGPLFVFDGFDILVHKLSNMDSNVPSWKEYNQHPYLVLHGLITKKVIIFLFYFCKNDFQHDLYCCTWCWFEMSA